MKKAALLLVAVLFTAGAFAQKFKTFDVNNNPLFIKISEERDLFVVESDEGKTSYTIDYIAVKGNSVHYVMEKGQELRFARFYYQRQLVKKLLMSYEEETTTHKGNVTVL